MKTSSLIKIAAAAIVLFLIAIQFFDTDKNIAAVPSENSIEKHYRVPEHMRELLKTSCYDCHSNTTVYPWYNNIQPVKWWLADHVNSGKRHLNFDEFNSYSKEKKLKKLDEVAETVREDEMPLTSYTVAHQNAKLTNVQKSEIEQWIKEVKKQIE